MYTELMVHSSEDEPPALLFDKYVKHLEDNLSALDHFFEIKEAPLVIE
jgi:hypothetical protein